MKSRNPIKNLRATLAVAFFPLFISGSAQAAFTYAGGVLNAAQTYDGLGVDSALNPRSQGTAADNDYIGNGNGGTGSITMTSGSLTIGASDFKVAQGTGSNGTIAANGGTLNINQIGQWGGGIGMSGTGLLNIASGAVVNWQTSGSNEQRFMIGNGGTGNGTLNLNGGTLNNTLDIAQTLNDAERQWRVGSDGGTGTINLNSGTWNVNGAIPFFLGGKYTTLNGTPTLNQSASVSVINITNGSLVQTGIATSTGFSTTGSTFTVGTNDYVNFITGGTGGLSIQGWDSTTDPGYTKFKALIDAGQIRKDGATFTPGDYSAFLFSDDSGQGVLKIDNSALVAPAIITQPEPFVDGVVGGSVNITASASGSPTPGLLWERSTDNGNNWTSTGVTTPTLTLTGLTYAMDGYVYRLVADNNVEPNATSDEAILYVTYPNPAISAQPVSIGNATAGGSASFTVTATGIGTLTYQWQKSTDAGTNWADVPSGGTSATLTFDPVAHSDAALYRCVLTDHGAEANSLPATETVSNWAYLALTNTSSGFVWNQATGTMVYDGTGVDSVINPFTQVGDDIAIGLGATNSASLTVNSGVLTLLNKDQWAPKIAQNSATGVVTVNAGGTLNIYDTGDGSGAANSQQRFTIGASANGTLNLNGGSVNVAVAPGADTNRGFIIGSGNTAATSGILNLNSGTLTYSSDARLNLGLEAAVGIINVGNGHLRVTGTSTVSIGGNDHINFVSGGTGSIAILGWDSVSDSGYAQFKSMIDGGKIFIDGVVVPAATYTSFIFSDDSGLGVMKLDPAALSGYGSWATANVGGALADVDTDLDGVKNGVEYFMNAAAGFTANPSVVTVGANRTVTWTNGSNILSADYGTQFVVQISTDLVNWTDVPVGSLTTNTDGPGGSLTYTLTGSGKSFVRLKVTPTN